MANWTEDNLPAQTDRVAIVTGSNSGIGFETARALAEKGARVVLACRSAERGEAAVARIKDKAPDADVRFLKLDLADLDQVREFADVFKQQYDRLDLLINNAGVMVPPKRFTTKQGFELQLGVNHLGHFALTGHLVDVLARTEGARVVNVASLAHRQGQMRWDDLHWEKEFKRWPSYGQSKLANLLFTLALQWRLAGTGVTATAAHPGFTSTNLQRHDNLVQLITRVVAMPSWQGALPTLHAAVAAQPGEYIGPNGVMEARGYPAIAKRVPAALDEADAERLWEVSEQLTGVRFGAEKRPQRAAA